MAGRDFGSLTKEPPLSTLDTVIRAATPGMSYTDLLNYARVHPKAHKDAPGLVAKRFLSLRTNGTIRYDHFLSLISVYDLNSIFIRKIMYFLWAYRDERIRRFICEVIANPDGKWRVNNLLDKSQSRFFETWGTVSTAKKAPSF